jgi:uncharacterized Zn-finger protein
MELIFEVNYTWRSCHFFYDTIQLHKNLKHSKNEMVTKTVGLKPEVRNLCLKAPSLDAIMNKFIQTHTKKVSFCNISL